MISSKQELGRHVDQGLFLVSGELHANGPGELVTERGALAVHDVRLSRNKGGGINYTLVIRADEPAGVAGRKGSGKLHRLGAPAVRDHRTDQRSDPQNRQLRGDRYSATEWPAGRGPAGPSSDTNYPAGAGPTGPYPTDGPYPDRLSDEHIASLKPADLEGAASQAQVDMEQAARAKARRDLNQAKHGWTADSTGTGFPVSSYRPGDKAYVGPSAPYSDSADGPAYVAPGAPGKSGQVARADARNLSRKLHHLGAKRSANK